MVKPNMGKSICFFLGSKQSLSTPIDSIEKLIEPLCIKIHPYSLNSQFEAGLFCLDEFVLINPVNPKNYI